MMNWLRSICLPVYCRRMRKDCEVAIFIDLPKATEGSDTISL
ncbi:unnamed protein product [Ranitomeya imitator]|uniref:Uncharacterized protein n=1 Tax=Ranitomeya imitator TaxID=111125 RepID=A0ABN9L8W8_9NEOB|nr:unnamed protein product [Ranitomeya imitator]